MAGNLVKSNFVINDNEFSEICNPSFSMEIDLGHYKGLFLRFYSLQTH